MNFRIASLALISALAACGSLEETRVESSSNAWAKSQPRNRVAWRQDDSAPGNKVEWFRSGLYLGGTLGWAQTTASASDIDGDLADLGYVDADTDLDQGDIAWKLFGGYRFEEPFALELAAVDLGTIESEVTATAVDVDVFLKDLANVHPFSAKGVALTGTWYALDQEDWQVGVKGGLWWWDGEVETRASSGEMVSESDRGVDLVLGVVGAFDVTDQWSLRAEIEHYWVDSEGVTLLALGAQWTPRRSNPRLQRLPSESGLPPALLRRSR